GQLELGRLYNGQVGGLFAFKNTPGIKARLPVRFTLTAAVADKSAGCDVVGSVVHCWQRVACSKPDDEIALSAVERIVSYEQCGGLLPNHSLECSLDFTLAARDQYFDGLRQGLGCLLHFR